MLLLIIYFSIQVFKKRKIVIHFQKLDQNKAYNKRKLEHKISYNNNIFFYNSNYYNNINNVNIIKHHNK